jgi:putative transposase
MLKYKADAVGIQVVMQEESYTSKCSFLDGESIEHHVVYKGERVSRGLFRTANGQLINADVNGALNILKKAFPNAFAEGIAGLVLVPFSLRLHERRK